MYVKLWTDNHFQIQMLAKKYICEWFSCECTHKMC